MTDYSRRCHQEAGPICGITVNAATPSIKPMQMCCVCDKHCESVTKSSEMVNSEQDKTQSSLMTLWF